MFLIKYPFVNMMDPKKKIGVVMREYKAGKLHSGSGPLVKKKKQAVAIALSEARKAGAKIPMKHEMQLRAMKRKMKK